MSGKRKEEDVGSEDALRDSPRETEAEGEGRPRYWLIGGVMLGLIVAIIAGAFLLNERFRPRVGIEPAPSVVVPKATPSAPALVVAVPPTAAPSLSAPPTATAAQAPTVAATSASTPSIGAVGAAKPTPSESLEREVEQAYLKYWDVYGDAMNTLDTSKLPEVAAGDRLQQAIAEVKDLKAAGKAARIQVQHDLLVFNVTDTSAAVRDEYVNNSYTVDPKTKSPMGTPGKGEKIVDTYFLERVDGMWKVMRGVRESP